MSRESINTMGGGGFAPEPTESQGAAAPPVVERMPDGRVKRQSKKNHKFDRSVMSDALKVAAAIQRHCNPASSAPINIDPLRDADMRILVDQVQRATKLSKMIMMAKNKKVLSVVAKLAPELQGLVANLHGTTMAIHGQLSSALNSRNNPHATNAPPVISVNGILREMMQLKRVFPRVHVGTSETGLVNISVDTVPITLQDTNGIQHRLNEFRITLNLPGVGSGKVIGDPRFRSGYFDFSIEALNPYPSRNTNLHHPHVKDRNLCQGEAKTLIVNALKRGFIAEFFQIVDSVLKTYNPDSPYTRLEEWRAIGNCAECSVPVTQERHRICAHNGYMLCPDHAVEYNGNWYHRREMRACPFCRASVYRGSLNANGLCATCAPLAVSCGCCGVMQRRDQMNAHNTCASCETRYFDTCQGGCGRRMRREELNRERTCPTCLRNANQSNFASGQRDEANPQTPGTPHDPAAQPGTEPRRRNHRRSHSVLNVPSPDPIVQHERNRRQRSAQPVAAVPAGARGGFADDPTPVTGFADDHGDGADTDDPGR